MPEERQMNHDRSLLLMKKAIVIKNSKLDGGLGPEIQEEVDPLAPSLHRRAPIMAAGPSIPDGLAEPRIIVAECNSDDSLEIKREKLKELRIRKSKTILSRAEQFKDKLN